MKKEEFPTFLNEQPTVVFGRTTRELLVILVGLTGAYLVWTKEWAAIGVFYFLTPKVYLYMPLEEPGENESGANAPQYQLSKASEGEDDEY